MKISKQKKIVSVLAICIVIYVLTCLIMPKFKDSLDTFATGSYPEYNMSSWLFFDPVNPDRPCNETNYWTKYFQDTTCYRWFVIEPGHDPSEKILLILDHNVSNTNYSGIGEVLASIESEWINYTGDVRILDEEEAASVLQLDVDKRPTLENIKVKNDLGTNQNLITNTWYYQQGQGIDNFGFWISTLFPENENYAYTISEFGENKLVKTSNIVGVRPVISIEKTKLTGASIEDLTSILGRSTSLQYKPIYYRPTNKTYRQLQGFTFSNDKLIFYSSNLADQYNGILLGYTGDNFNSSVFGYNTENNDSAGFYLEGGIHGNDMTYNPDTGEIMMTTVGARIWKFDENELKEDPSITEEDNTISVGTEDKLWEGAKPGSIGYDEIDHMYILGIEKRAYFTNSNFEGPSYSIDMPHNEYGQGLEYHNGYIYQTGWKPTNCASGVLYCDNLSEGSAIINVYNAKFNEDGTPSKSFGRRAKSMFIEGYDGVFENGYKGELESIAFHGDEAYLGFTSPRKSDGTCQVRNESDPETKERCFTFYHFSYSNIAVNLQTKVEYVDTPDSTTVTITSDDQLQLKDGYIRASDGYGISKTVYTDSISETLQVCDRYSNCSTVNISHNNDSYRQPQVVTFANESVSKTYGDASFTNAANTNGDGSILYSSDNLAVATVNPSTGEVIIVGAGTANITATASQTDFYGEGTSSYALTVAKATSTRPSELDNTFAGVAGEPLSTITFATTGISWTNGDAIIAFGENEYQVNYTQDNDASNYTTEIFTVTVKGAVHVYLVIEGNNQIYVKNESEVASFRIDVNFSLFEEYGSIYVDGQQLSSDSYRAESGSTIISLKKSYVDSLAVGLHDFTVTFGDFGIATARFTITNAQDEPGQSNDTANQGDTDMTVSNIGNNTSSYKSSAQKDDSDIDNDADDVTVPDTGNNTKEGDNMTVDILYISALLLPVLLLGMCRASRRRIRHRKF